jgi:phospholipid/cholesterol/gamma-HCH transport system substrate-binding protein
MDSKVNFAAVGAFVIGLGAVLVAAVLWLAAGGELHHKVDLYRAVSDESVAGLNINAPVKYRGVDVGKVKDIHLVPNNPQQVQLTFAIERGTPVKTDTVATLSTQGLTGIAYVELSGGSTTAPLLVSTVDGEPPLIMTKPSLSARLEQVLTRVLGSVDKTSHALDGVFTEQNKQALSAALTNIAAITQTVADRKGSIDLALRNADKTMANAAVVSARMDATLARIDKAADSFDAMSRQVDKTAGGAGETVTAVGSDLQHLSGDVGPQLETLMTELSTLSGSLRRLSEQTERNPKSLVFGKTPVPKGPGE